MIPFHSFLFLIIIIHFPSEYDRDGSEDTYIESKHRFALLFSSKKVLSMSLTANISTQVAS